MDRIINNQSKFRILQKENMSDQQYKERLEKLLNRYPVVIVVIIDKELILDLVTESGLFLRFASEALKSDKDIVLAALKQNPKSIEYVNNDILNDRDVSLFLNRRNNYFKDRLDKLNNIHFHYSKRQREDEENFQKKKK